MERLRAPGGCPWDREQTFDSIKPYTLEETYEVLEAIDNRDWDELPGELGDLLLQVLFYSEMAKEQGSFSIDDVLDRLSKKLVDRHPHVFGDVKAETSAEVKRNWEALKGEERKKRRSSESEEGSGEKSAESQHSALAGVSSAMPSLLEAYKLSSRAAQVGFDWPNIEGLFDKLHEETVELREQLKDFPKPGPRPQGHGMAGAGRQQICFSSWSILRAICRSTRNPRCARPTGNSSAASSGWKNACPKLAERQSRPQWRNSSRYGSKPNFRRSNFEL